MVPVHAPGRQRRRARAHRRHLGRRRPAASTPPQSDVYYFAPQKCFASDGGLWLALRQPGRAGAHRRGRRRGDRWIPEFLSLTTALDNRVKDQTYNTPALATLLPARRPGRVDERATAASSGPSGRTTESSSRAVRLGRGARRSRRRSSPTRPSARSSSARSTSTTRVDAAAVAKTLRANGIVDTEPYRKLGRNQLRVAMFPAIEPDDVRGAHRVHRLSSWRRTA